MGWGELGEGKSLLVSVRRRHNAAAEKKESMRSMLERLENYLDRKGLQLNTEKRRLLGLGKREGG